MNYIISRIKILREVISEKNIEGKITQPYQWKSGHYVYAQNITLNIQAEQDLPGQTRLSPENPTLLPSCL
jgi:hypothetical protein